MAARRPGEFAIAEHWLRFPVACFGSHPVCLVVSAHPVEGLHRDPLRTAEAESSWWHPHCLVKPAPGLAPQCRCRREPVRHRARVFRVNSVVVLALPVAKGVNCILAGPR